MHFPDPQQIDMPLTMLFGGTVFLLATTFWFLIGRAGVNRTIRALRAEVEGLQSLYDERGRLWATDQRRLETASRDLAKACEERDSAERFAKAGAIEGALRDSKIIALERLAADRATALRAALERAENYIASANASDARVTELEAKVAELSMPVSLANLSAAVTELETAVASSSLAGTHRKAAAAKRTAKKR